MALRRVAVALSLGLALCSACSGSGVAPNPTTDAGTGCEPCPTNLGCDATTRTCIPASQAGGRCGTSALDGGPTVCVDGTTCGPVADGVSVCARPCVTSADCLNGQGCFANPVGVAARQYCATEVAVGSSCSIEGLQECTGSNGAVVACVGSSVSGVCYGRCSTASDCPSGQNCSAAFSDGDGVCVKPTTEGSSCDESNPAAYVLCSAGQVCVESTPGDGVCHSSCGADAGTCAGSEVCTLINPCGDGQGFCVTPAAQGGACNVADAQYCAPADDCVDLPAGFSCELDCTSGESCPSGTTCKSLPATDGGYICRKACF